MARRKPADGKSVWIEYPQSVHVRAVYEAARDAFVLEDGTRLAAGQTRGWPHRNPEAKKHAGQPGIVVRLLAVAARLILDLF